MSVVFISGNIGSGKSTLFNSLKDKFPKAHFIPEYIDGDPQGHNKLLSYLNGELNAFEFQSYILDYYEAQLSQIKGHKLTIVERSPLEGIMTFAQLDHEKGLMSEEEWEQLRKRAEHMIPFNAEKRLKAHYNINEIQDPSLNTAIVESVIKHYMANKKRFISINLRIPPETCMKNIKERNREGEDAYTMDRLRRLDYNEWCYWNFWWVPI